MGAPYTSVPILSYNANPPADDGSQVAANRVTWAGQKDKLTDPLKTAIERINTNITSAMAKVVGGGGVTTTAISYGVGVSDQGKLVKATAASITITTPDATSVTSPFVFGFLNASTGNVTLDGSGTQTIDGALTVVVPAGCGCFLFTDGTNWFTSGQNFVNSTVAPVPGNFKNLSIKVASNTTVTVAADVVVMTNGTNFLTKVVSSTVNLGTSVAVDALDTGTIAIDSWYHMWAIAKADGTTKVIASLQSTANATFLTNLAAIASGAYTYYARLGAVQTIHGSATLYGTWQFGRRAQYVNGLAQTTIMPLITSGITGTYSTTSPTLASITVVGNGKWAPTTASEISVIANNNYFNGGNGAVLVAPSTAYGGTNRGPNGSAGNAYPLAFTSAVSQSLSVTMLLESAAIGVAADGGYFALSCLGWEDNI